jgi:eukaryotic-like serine/threonine-protein kinase
MTLVRGTLLNKRYRIVDILGQGGMASVYRAIDENLGVEVAVKENLFTTEEYARQFRLEATILANLRHPNLPRVTDHFVIHDQGQYLVMDYIEGEDLRQRMDRLGVLPEEEVVVIGSAICDALNYLHSRSPMVLHRDIKPGNVKIDPKGEIFLVDFGLAKVVEEGQATTTGARAMTPGYSPPEQYGTARTDPRSDIYSLGATLYSALTDELPEDGLERAMDQAKLTSLRQHNPKVVRRLGSVIEKALEVRPEDRYQTAEAFRQGLLNARSSSRRKTPVELVLPPPPEWSTLEGDAELHKDNPPNSPVGDFNNSLRLGGESAPVIPPRLREPEKSSGKLGRPYVRSSGRQVLFGLLSFVLLLLVGTYLFSGQGFFSVVLPHTPPASTKTSLIASISTSSTSVSLSRPSSTSDQEATAPVTASPDVRSETIPPGTAAPTRTPRLSLTRTATPAEAVIPLPTPLGGGQAQIVFASDRNGMPNLWLVDIDGTGQKQLTDISEGACQPDWSPDGKRLVFISPCRNIGEFYRGSSLFMINADGTGLTPLPSAPGGDFDPSWSPDGKRIAFTSVRNQNIPQIFILDLEANEVTLLNDENNRANSQPSWSPDGKRLAFVGPRNQIWIMSDDGSERFLVSRPSDYINRSPSWSPDGKTIVFTQFVEGRAGAPWLASVKAEVNSLTVVVSREHPMSRASYSPDGYWLVFQSWPESSFRDIYIMTINGVGRQRLTDTLANDFDPVWRPDLVP